MKFTVRHARVSAARVTRRLVRNPQYGGEGVSLNGWKSTPVEPVTGRKPKFFEALRESVRREGFRNPIIVYALPEGLFLGFGCSRLRVAQELDAEIPALVNDYTGEFDTAPEVTPSNWREFFTDVPEYFEWLPYGIDYHYSLERNRRETYDPKGMAWTESSPDRSFLTTEFPWLDEQS